MTIAEEIARAQALLSDPPPNEASTCEWVVLPTLWAMGYERREILSRVSDNNGQFPDYTLLPNSEHTWFIEAKAWNTGLLDAHAQQSLNYANSNGRRWVVLTNGQVWRLYDNDIRGLASDKLVVEAGLHAPERLEELLTALSCGSVRQDGIEQFVKRFCLSALLARQMGDPASEVIQTLTALLLRKPGLTGLTPQELVDYFAERFASGTAAVANVGDPDADEACDPTDGAGNAIALTDLLSAVPDPVTGRRPCGMILPDGTERPVRSWADVAQAVVAFLTANQLLPTLPYSGRARGKSYFLNRTPDHQHAPMAGFRKAEAADVTLYIDTNRSAPELIRSLCGLCGHVGFPAERFKVRLPA